MLNVCSFFWFICEVWRISRRGGIDCNSHTFATTQRTERHYRMHIPETCKSSTYTKCVCVSKLRIKSFSSSCLHGDFNDELCIRKGKNLLQIKVAENLWKSKHVKCWSTFIFVKMIQHEPIWKSKRDFAWVGNLPQLMKKARCGGNKYVVPMSRKIDKHKRCLLKRKSRKRVKTKGKRVLGTARKAGSLREK